MDEEPGTLVWRAAALRGLSYGNGHDEALVALGVEQYLRVPVPPGRLEAWNAHLGRRVWVQMDTGAVQLDQPGAACHA